MKQIDSKFRFMQTLNRLVNLAYYNIESVSELIAERKNLSTGTRFRLNIARVVDKHDEDVVKAAGLFGHKRIDTPRINFVIEDLNDSNKKMQVFWDWDYCFSFGYGGRDEVKVTEIGDIVTMTGEYFPKEDVIWHALSPLHIFDKYKPFDYFVRIRSFRNYSLRKQKMKAA